MVLITSALSPHLTPVRYYAGTQLQATEARKMYPCMDEVDMKSTFTVSVEKLYPHQVALSNMPVNFTTSLFVFDPIHL